MRVRGSSPQVPSRLLVLAACGLTALGVVGSSSAVERARTADVGPHVPGELIVRFARTTDTKGERAALVAEHGGRVEETLTPEGLAVVQVDPGAPIAQAAAELEAEAGVVYAEPNYRRKLASRTPNDPRFGELWGLAKIAAPAAWDLTTGSGSVTVAVVDTGVAYDHPDLAPNVWTNENEDIDGVDDDGNGRIDDVRGWDFVGAGPGDNDPDDESGHGTHVAGTIGARGNDGVGVTGVNWSVKVMAVRAGDDYGLADSDIIQSFRYACQNGARVINGSFGGYGPEPQALLDAVRTCPAALFVFAAGNEGSDNDVDESYPCGFDLPNVLCVAASDPSDALPEWSNYGATEVDLAAPGMSILSTSSARTVFSDSFDGPLIGWEAGGTGGRWAQTTEASVSPPNSITDSPGAPHADNASAWIRRTASFSLAGHAACSLDARVRSDFDWLDRVKAEASTDGVWDDQDVLEVWAGATGGIFETWSIGLWHLDGEPSVRIGYALDTDGTGLAGDGAHIDDVAVRCYHGTAAPTGHESWDGTSMATPHVAGAAGLVLAHRPAATVAELRSALLSAVDPVASLAGKVATGGRLNVARALGVSAPPPQSPPVADDQSVATAEDTARPITLTARDADGDPLTYAVVAGPSHGSLGGTAPNLTYTPDTNYHGPDSFTFRASDGRADSGLATVSIIVASVNDPPVAAGQSLSTPYGEPLDMTLTATDVDSPELGYEVVAAPANGTLSGTAPLVRYAPAGGFSGRDTFTFRAVDGDGAASSAVTVSVDVGAPPPPPAPPPPLPPPATPPPPPPSPSSAPAQARCVVPNVKGKRVPAARTALARGRCALGRVSRSYSARVRAGRIISQSKRPGTRHARGTRVHVVVSRGRRR